MSDDLFLEELEILQEIRSHAQAQSKLIATMTTSLKNIEKSLAVRGQHNAPLSPNYRRRYSEYQGFNWASIGAHVVASDKHGPADVEFAGHRFNRSMGEKFNEPFLIFSRPAPEWTQTNKVYYTLIRFADYDKTPLDPPPAADSSRDPARPPAETTKPNRSRQSQAKPPAGYYSATPDEIAAADRMQAEREAQGLPITATVTDPAELAKPGNRSAQLPDQPQSEGQTRPAHWASQPEAQPEPPTTNPQSAIPNPQSADPQSAIPNPQFLAAAQQITDPPAFYEFVNKLIQQDKTIVQRIKPVVDDPATTWTEKAVLLIGG